MTRYRNFRKPAKLFKALSNERRLILLEFLSKQRVPEQFAVRDIAEALKIPYKLVSRHLQILDQSDLIERTRHGQTVGYRVTGIAKRFLNQIENLLKI